MTSFRAFAALVAAQVIPGFACSSTRAVQRPDVLPPDQGMVQARAITNVFAGRDVEVKLSRSHSGSVGVPESLRSGRLAALDGQSYLLYEPSGSFHRTLFEDTHSMTSKDRGKGATRGLLFGALAGAAAGAIFGSLLSGLGCSDMGTHIECPSGAGLTASGALVGGLLVGALGAGVGALIGYRTTLTF
jgi:hypothetical protein